VWLDRNLGATQVNTTNAKMESLINTIEIRTINIRINSQPVALRIRSSLSPQEGVTANKIRCLAIINSLTLPLPAKPLKTAAKWT
jgi:hypothetical protein